MLNNLQAITKNEFSYQLKSGIVWVIALILIALCIVNYHNKYNNAIQNYELFTQTKDNMEADGYDIEKELQKTPEIKKEGGTEVIENVLAYDYNNLVSSLIPFQFKDALSNTFEWLSFVFFPIIFALYGLITATYDYHYKTIKMKAVTFSFKNIFIGKILAMSLYALLIIILLIIITYGTHYIYRTLLISQLPYNEFASSIPASNSHSLWIVMFALSVMLLFAIFGMSIGFIVKSALIPAIILLVFNFMIPILGVYDPRNLLANFGHQLFNFQGNFQLFSPKPVPLVEAGAAITLSFLILTLLSFFISNQQSKYVK
ncbi:ABC transporter permease subunit [Pontibacillus salicampi]|uniref:ABC transporter permease subunit n=1 Tax=Pontibacillus salicampi TaxID=1449801 RepID=A0ABV6LM12_9BACI